MSIPARRKTRKPLRSSQIGGKIIFSVNACNIDGYSDLMGHRDIIREKNDNESNSTINKTVTYSMDFRLEQTRSEHDSRVFDEGKIRIPRKMKGTACEMLGLDDEQPKSALKMSPWLPLYSDPVRFGNWQDGIVRQVNSVEQTTSKPQGSILGGTDRGQDNTTGTLTKSVTFMSDSFSTPNSSCDISL